MRTAISHNIEVFGFKRGYDGLIKKDYVKLDSLHVAEIMQKGGTILLSARCKEMMTDEGKQKAIDTCKSLGIEALIVIGGDGSLTGALYLSKLGIKVMGIPGTIDLDLPCSDYTIGFDTAVNTAMECISKIRDTSSSHERCTIIEVMGRNAGYIALWCGLTNGAEEVLIPEKPDITPEDVINMIKKNREHGKISNVVIVGEGYPNISSQDLAKKVEKETGIETRATILGHLQRGGSPTAIDRMYASIMGHTAVEKLVAGDTNKIMIYKDGKHSDIDLEEGLKVARSYNDYIYKLTKIFAL